jgi:predicted membrane protein
METSISDAVGMLGTLLVVLAYFLLQLERTDPKGLSYNLLNLLGALLLLFSLCFTFNLASFVIELFWIAASLIGMWRYWRRRDNPGHYTS